MIDDRNKYIEQWWLKYEAMGNLDEEFPPSRALLFDLINSVHRHSLDSGKTSAHVAEDLAHHTTMQQIFKKWQQVHGPTV